MNYVIIEPIAQGNAAHFKHIENFENWELLEGISLLDTFPEDGEYRMSDDFPDSIELHDVLHNLDGQIIINTRVRSFFDEEGVKFVEYLPVNIINHKGRKVSEKYFICNFLKVVDCIDQEKTKFEWDSLDDERMDDVKNLTIDESRVDPDILLFRLKFLNSVIVIQRSFVQKIRAAGFKGFKIIEIKDYKW